MVGGAGSAGGVVWFEVVGERSAERGVAAGCIVGGSGLSGVFAVV